tara:strand:- start:3782 stop:4051 length:270 start_codon:yes stop_codon:yes gene_type:complete
MAKKSKAKKVVAKEPEPESEVCETCGKESCVCEAEEIIEEILEETPKAEIVEERELPEETGEETSETVMLGGRLMRKVINSSGVQYIPL